MKDRMNKDGGAWCNPCPPEVDHRWQSDPRSAALLKCLLAALLICSATLTAFGQYSINWYKVSGGGGTSTGGRFSLSGTIGQHDAGGPLQNGVYSLTGGFWALYAVQTLGAPALTITLTPTNTVVVSWPSPSTGFALKQNTSLGTASWTTPPQTVNDNGLLKYIVVNPPAGNQFYRLQHP